MAILTIGCSGEDEMDINIEAPDLQAIDFNRLAVINNFAITSGTELSTVNLDNIQNFNSMSFNKLSTLAIDNIMNTFTAIDPAITGTAGTQASIGIELLRTNSNTVIITE